MQFNSLTFFVFLPIVFSFYWFIINKKSYQNLILLVSSYIFYCFWDWRFLSLIIISTITDYMVGLIIDRSNTIKIKRFFLCVSIIINLGILFIFKYYDFFILSWIELFSSFGYEIKNNWTIELILPLGISFYTFH